MKIRILLPVCFLLMISQSLFSADIRFVMITDYNVPNFKEGDVILDPEVINKIEIELKGEEGIKK